MIIAVVEGGSSGRSRYGVGVHSMSTVWVGVSNFSRNALGCLGVLSLSRSVHSYR